MKEKMLEILRLILKILKIELKIALLKTLNKLTFLGKNDAKN